MITPPHPTPYSTNTTAFLHFLSFFLSWQKQDRDELQEVRNLSAQDTFRVQFWRFYAVTAFLLTALGLIVATFRTLQLEDEHNYKADFRLYAKALTDAALEHQRDIREALLGFSQFLSTHAMTNDLLWPFVTIPLFEAYAETARRQGRLEMISTNTYLQEKNREAYVNYATDNLKWVQDGHRFQYGHLDHLLESVEQSYHPYIGAFATTESSHDNATTTANTHYQPDIVRSEYWPLWQSSPPPTTYQYLHWNMFGSNDYANVVSALQQVKNEIVMTPVRLNSMAQPLVAAATATKEQDSNNPNNNPNSLVFYPVHKVVGASQSDMVAMVGAAIAWNRALQNVIPDGVRSMDAVLTNNCHQTFTYRVNGPDVTFLGDGDWHNSDFSDIGVEMDLTTQQQQQYVSHPNVPATPGHCQYSLRIYPTSDFRASYESDTPAAFTAVVATVFFFVCMLFYIYDITVANRNDRLLVQAAQSNALVSSLFPNSIRERLMGERASQDDAFKQAYGLRDQGSIKAFMKDGMTSQVEVRRGKPIADLFPDTTVLFGDLAGFTGTCVHTCMHACMHACIHVGV